MFNKETIAKICVSTVTILLITVIYWHPKKANKPRFEQSKVRPSPYIKYAEPKFTAGHIHQFYIYGASIRNNSKRLVPEEIAIYGLWPKDTDSIYFNHSTTRCCLRYGRHQTVESKIIRHIKRPWNKDNVENNYYMSAFYFVCALPSSDGIGRYLPSEASIAYGQYECTDNKLPYVETFLPEKKKSASLGVSGKVIYGSMSGQALIEWFEALIYLRVDRVLVYADESLNSEAMRVLEHYNRIGYCEVNIVSLPDKDLYPRVWSHQDEQICFDYQMILWDSLERLRGYTYYGLLDTDEFLIPSKGRSLIQLLIDLDKVYNAETKRYAGFFFTSNVFPKDWKKDKQSSDLEIGQIIKRMPGDPIMEFWHKKSFIFPEYVEHYLGGETPVMNTNVQLKMLDVPSREGYTRHYRNCDGWRECPEDKAVIDREMLEWSQHTIESKVHAVRKYVLANWIKGLF